MRRNSQRILLVTMIALIWGHSAMPPDLSSMESGFVFRLLFAPLAFFFGAENVTEYLIRKAAHFLEYAALGCLLSLDERRTLSWGGALGRLNFGLLVAFLDETIQIFSGRGAQIADVWLDLSGVLAAVVAMAAWNKMRIFLCGGV